MQTSIRGKAALAASEGIVPAVYLDSVGVPTYGVGVTHWAVGEETFATYPTAMPRDIDAAVDDILDLYEVVLPQYERIVLDAVTVPLQQHQFDALVHFAYNVGGPNFRRSKLLRWINAGDFESAAQKGFHGWLKPRSLLSRRDLESAMFRGHYPDKPVPVYQTDGQMNLRGILKTYDPLDIVAMLKAPPRGRVTEQFRVPQDMIDAAQDAGKPLRLCKTAWSTIPGMGVSAWQAWQAADPIVQATSIAAVALLVVVFFERWRKSRLGRAALAQVGL